MVCADADPSSDDEGLISVMTGLVDDREMGGTLVRAPKIASVTCSTVRLIQRISASDEIRILNGDSVRSVVGSTTRSDNDAKHDRKSERFASAG